MTALLQPILLPDHSETSTSHQASYKTDAISSWLPLPQFSQFLLLPSSLSFSLFSLLQETQNKEESKQYFFYIY